MPLRGTTARENPPSPGYWAGALRNQSGNIRLFDKDFDYFTPKTAVNNNIGVVYQIPETVPDMNVVENIFIGRMPHFLITAKDRAYMRQTCRELFTFLNIDLDINTPLRKLSKSELQIVSIARVLSLGARILVLDEDIPASDAFGNEGYLQYMPDDQGKRYFYHLYNIQY